MNTKNAILPIILCGGTGSRLWPLSRKSFPKQYLAMSNEENSTFLQTTIQRIKGLDNCKDPIIVCNEEHRFITAEQLRQIGVKPGAILLEPCSQNTAPAIAVSALRSLSQDEDQLLLILPSDHLITNEKNFLESIKMAQTAALEGKIVTFGIKPNNPSTGFGYIKAKGPVSNSNNEFVEWPGLLLQSKKYS